MFHIVILLMLICLQNNSSLMTLPLILNSSFDVFRNSFQQENVGNLPNLSNGVTIEIGQF